MIQNIYSATGMRLIGLLIVVLFSWVSPAEAGRTFDAIKANGTVRCGVATYYKKTEINGVGQNKGGLDRLICRSIAAAVLGDSKRVTFVTVSASKRFSALQAGDYDVLIRGTTWTLTRDASKGLHFAGVNFYDGQGFIVRRDLGVSSILKLKNAKVCVETDTTSADNLTEFAAQHGLNFQAIPFRSHKEVRTAFFSGRCDVYTADRSTLAAARLSVPPSPDDFVVLPQAISKEPLGPVVRDDDNAWFRIVKWSLNALIEAEELGITSENIDQMSGSNKASVQRLVGIKPGIGKPLGLDDKWAYRMIKQVGNYGEIYASTVGSKSKMGLSRGLNALWKDGGLMYALPLR
jgi:general L-amino acid transport system substrate-binding protein